jgi:hypothetical protein
MYGSWGSSWDWLWMALMAVLWLVVLAGVVYAAVRLAMEHEHRPPLSH